MKVRITKVINHGEFLQTFAEVTLDEDTVRAVNYCHKSLPFTEDGVFNALMNQALAPPYIEPRPDPHAPNPPPIDPKNVKPHVPDVSRVARVKALKASFDKLKATEKTIEMGSAEAIGMKR